MIYDFTEFYNIRYADNIVLIVVSEEKLRELLGIVDGSKKKIQTFNCMVVS